MPPPVSSKGKGKNHSRDGRQSRSRNSTPVSAGAVVTPTVEPTPSSAYFQTQIAFLTASIQSTLEDVLDRSGSSSNIPSASSLQSMQETVKTNFTPNIKLRGEICDRVLRELSKKRKERAGNDRERERFGRDTDDRKHKLKKIKKKDAEEERPLAVGAHSVARQDGIDVHKDISSDISSPVSPAPKSAEIAPPESAPSPSDSESSHQPPPASAIPQYQTFGPDPSKFNDPTIYHVREVHPGMHDEQKKEIYCVALYPESDLHELTPGTPPDKDFSSAKPANQVNATVFANYVEPFIRPLTEEDVAFLKERGDRVTPFILPSRGPRHYREMWAEEDATSTPIDLNPKNPHEARGSMDTMTDDIAETDEISTGPVLARLLSTMRVERRGAGADSTDINGTAHGDMEVDGDQPNGESQPLQPATHMPESSTASWKNAQNMPKADYANLDERVLQELRHIGFLSPEDASDTQNYAGHFDDEVAARLRFLQSELRKQSIINGARKGRILELTMERMAQQEYNTIADDLDNQLNQAYLKRNRSLAKPKKTTKRPGGAGGGSHPVAGGGAGIGKLGVGESIKILMDRKSDWNRIVGPVVNYGKTSVPGESVFLDSALKKLIDKETEGWDVVEE